MNYAEQQELSQARTDIAMLRKANGELAEALRLARAELEAQRRVPEPPPLKRPGRPRKASNELA